MEHGKTHRQSLDRRSWKRTSSIKPGSVIFNEIQWDGYNGRVDPAENLNLDSRRPQDFVYNDEYIELLNTTDEPIDLSMWTIATDDDFVVGLYQAR